MAASSLFFTPFNSDVYSNKLVFSITPQVPKIQFIPQFNVNSFGFIDLSKPTRIIEHPRISPKIIIEKKEITIPQATIETPPTIKTITIMEQGFTPKTLVIRQGETVKWINKRPHAKSLVHGVRELSGMRSPMLEENEIFTWKFDDKGTFVYVDSVVIGRIGKIIVQ